MNFSFFCFYSPPFWRGGGGGALQIRNFFTQTFLEAHDIHMKILDSNYLHVW